MIKVIIPKQEDNNKAAVYRLRIGSKYYIGATADTTQRAILHEQNINNSLKSDWKPGRNSPTLILIHLRAHPEIDTLYMEIIIIVESQEELVQAEQDQFNISCTDQNCLNFRLKSHRKVNETEVRPTYIAPWVPKG